MRPGGAPGGGDRAWRRRSHLTPPAPRLRGEGSSAPRGRDPLAGIRSAGGSAPGRDPLRGERSADPRAAAWAPEATTYERIVRDVLDVEAPPAEVLRTLEFIAEQLIPNLEVSAHDEIANILRALDGGYVPAGPSGAPTRGHGARAAHGRNFYAIDPRTMPSRSAWRVGQQLATELVERHRRETGAYPHSVGLSIWGTSAMRTHGDDIAQVFALLGVRPVWQSESQRLIGTEVLSLEELGRPRVDVTCRISGFFRDAFPHVLGVIDDAVRRVAEQDEPPEQNPLRARYLADRARLEATGLDTPTASRRAGYRVFGSKPGTYGAGILPLIDAGNWQTGADFATAYVNWGGYAYTGEDYGVDARTEFETVLARVEVAAKNQDNREHDIFDSDDYLQFHGGMIATIRALSGSAPRRYFGDTSDPARARVRDLKEEALRVFRTRVVNPKWIGRIQEHGYKGALELAATVDYLFGYDATADVLDDWMYAEVTRAYVLDPEMQAFFARSNPWALEGHRRAAARGDRSRDVGEASRGDAPRHRAGLPGRRGNGRGPRRKWSTSVRPLYPFSALVGQEPMKLALVLNAINPRLGGVLIRGQKGTAKSTAARGLAVLLPPVDVVDGCRFGCEPRARGTALSRM